MCSIGGGGDKMCSIGGGDKMCSIEGGGQNVQYRGGDKMCSIGGTKCAV